MAQRLKNISSKFVSQSTKYMEFLQLVPQSQKQILKKVQKWASQNLQTQQINQCYQNAKFPKHLLKSLNQLKITQYFVQGNKKISPFTKGLILSILASYDASVAMFLMLQVPLCGQTLRKLGSKQQYQKYIDDLLSLKKVWGWALTQQKVGSYASSIQSNVRLNKNGDYILNGNKRWIGNGDGDYLIVYAKNLDQNNKINAFIVDMKSQGIRRNVIPYKLGLRQVQNCQIYFENVIIPSQNKLPEATSYRRGVQKILMSSRFNVIFLTLGVCHGIYRNVSKYANNRIQFQVPITSFQLVQQKLVKIMSNIQAMNTITWHLSNLQQKGQNTIGTIAMFKAHFTQTARQISRWGRQLLGGNGITHDLYMMKALTDIQALYTLQGTWDINILIAGRQLTGMQAFRGAKSMY